MNKLMKYRRFIMNMIGVLPLILSLGTSNVAFAASSTSNISVTIVAERNTVKEGQTITYTATMTNLVPKDANFVDVGFGLPDQLNLVSMICDLGISPDTPFCEYSSLNAGETVISTLVATPNPDVQNHKKHLVTTAAVSFEVDCSFDPNCTFDPNNRNNSASVAIKLIGSLAHP